MPVGPAWSLLGALGTESVVLRCMLFAISMQHIQSSLCDDVFSFLCTGFLFLISVHMKRLFSNYITITIIVFVLRHVVKTFTSVLNVIPCGQEARNRSHWKNHASLVMLASTALLSEELSMQDSKLHLLKRFLARRGVEIEHFYSPFLLLTPSSCSNCTFFHTTKD